MPRMENPRGRPVAKEVLHHLSLRGESFVHYSDSVFTSLSRRIVVRVYTPRFFYNNLAHLCSVHQEYIESLGASDQPTFFLLITDHNNREVDYWLLPFNLVRQATLRHHVLKIRQVGERYLLRQVDVTQYHAKIRPLCPN